MATTPAFAATPRSIDKVAVSVANTNRDGTGTIATLATGSVAGFKIFQVVVKAKVTTSAGIIRIYLSVDSGTTWELFDEIEVVVVTVGPSVASYRNFRSYENLVLTGTTNRIGASTQIGEAFTVFCLGADL